MPNQQKGQPQQGQHNGGSMQGAREQLQGAGQKIQEGAAQVGERVREGYEAASEAAAHRYRQAEGMVARNPGQSILVGFGVGFGLGVLLTVLLARREEESWYEKYVPDSLRDVPDHLRHLPDRLRHMRVPESIARHMPGH
jgi:ElaB/YqjD/DUF883 family membrane-anchored ribosome-binding protein